MPRSPNSSFARPCWVKRALAENIDTNNILRLLADTAVNLEAIIDEYDIDTPKQDSDEECASSTLAFDKYYNTGGSEAIMQMKNFDMNESGKQWLLLQDHVTETCTVNVGRPSKFSGKYLLLFALTALKQGRQLKYSEWLSRISGPTFECIVM